MSYFLIAPRFPGGRLLVSDRITALRIPIIPLICRHLSGDWGEEICPDDVAANNAALIHGDALLSHFSAFTESGERMVVSIFTEADRSVTVAFIEGEDC
ncbi:MAG: hypothetical protein H7Y36_09840 [Armatimonadetes bacterium]|nr:hypothetical protein [Akkermansiaceae bacterium]